MTTMDPTPARTPLGRMSAYWWTNHRQHFFGFFDGEGSFCRCGERGPAVTMDGDPIEPSS